ncbi:hypothetical protein KP509_01G055800 [Ceratopteris richardii]|nr:hypothetical protein KP509_01G055800 [Ceratopteris richardii]
MGGDEDGNLESWDQKFSAMDLASEVRLSSSITPEAVVSHLDLASVANIKEENELQGHSEQEIPETSSLKSTIEAPYPPPSTPELEHDSKSHGNQFSSPTLAHLMGEGRVPLWIKWRGKWQAGLQCSLEDCPAQTVKAMPTYGKKSYIVVYFPSSKSFVWTDWQLVCPISEHPEPLAFGTHQSGRDSVADLNGARQCMLRKIGSALLDISDCLPLQAVVDCARTVSFWKDYAKDADRATTYQELGCLLVTMKKMILPTFIKDSWLQDSSENWMQQCERAETAASVEKLAKELKNAVVWDEVGKLWDQVEQVKLGSEWKTWKENSVNESNTYITGHRRPLDEQCSDIDGGHDNQHFLLYDGIKDDAIQDRKRVKIEDNSSVPELKDRNAYIVSVSAASNETRSSSLTPHKSSANELANALHDKKKGKRPMVDARRDDSSGLICIGTTKYRRRCTHKAKDGSVYCLKHMVKLDNADNHAADPSSGEISGRMEPKLHLDQSVKDVTFSKKQKLVTVNAGQSTLTCSKTAKLASKKAVHFANSMRCIGWCGNGLQCSHRAKVGFSYCEKHLPSSVKGHERSFPNNDTERHRSQENSMCLKRVRKLVNEYINVRLGEDGAQSSDHTNTCQRMIDAICAQLNGNLSVSETLYKLVSSEMDNLKRHFEQEVTEVQAPSSGPFPALLDEAGCSKGSAGGEVLIEQLSNVELLNHVTMQSTTSISGYRCRFCTQDFNELNTLGEHWRSSHKKEAQKHFRRFACKHCNLPFTNKKGLYRHRNSHHPEMCSPTKSSLLAVCKVCSGQFTNFDELWKHVICSHSDQLCTFGPVSRSKDLSTTPWMVQGPESFDFGKCSDCDKRFSTYTELQQHRECSHKSEDADLHRENSESISSKKDELKFKCKHCGLRFRLLPDLGRHHQAEHKPAQNVKSKTTREDESLYRTDDEWKSNIEGQKEQKKLQKLNVRRAPMLSPTSETTSTTQNAVHSNQVIAVDARGYNGPFPPESDILAIARSVCCINKLCSVFQEKYTWLPESLALEVSRLCNEANITLEILREGYICPNSCKHVKPSRSISLSTNDLSSSLQRNDPSNNTHQPTHVKDIVIANRKGCLNDKLVLCEDISFGKERVPIPCVVDADALGPCSCPICFGTTNNDPETLKPWLHFTYVVQRTLDPSLGLDTESSGLGCSCQGSQCLSAQCEHVHIFDNDNNDAEDIYGQPMMGRFPYDDQGCIILEEGYLVYECNSLCSCHESCQNRVLQKGVGVRLEVYKTRHKGWAVRAAQHIVRGTFVCEYIGEVLDDFEANKRGERYDKEGCSYLYDIDAHIRIGRRGRSKPFVIDATKFGNVARFINHSCSPNLVNYQVLVESMDCQLAHIGLYATRDIDVGEELAYDYRYKLLPGKGCPCHCGAKDCRGRLY